MDFDIFFSISQTPTAAGLPSEAQMFTSFFRQVKVADELGFGVAWFAESHLSSEVQKRNRKPVVPHWEGEIGLNVNWLQLAARVFAQTDRIECGAAIMNIVCMGGPISAAERIAAFGALHGLDPDEQRRFHVGFSGGRFDFMNAATGVGPRNAFEEKAWRVVKGRVVREASEIFLRLLRGDVLSSDDVTEYAIGAQDFRSSQDWDEALAIWEVDGGALDADGKIPLPRRWVFEELEVVPRSWRRELVQPIIGSHDPVAQVQCNAILPVQVFNLSITRPEVIEATHARMTEAYHPSGGAWKRSYMPRTTFVFLNEQPGLTPVQRREAAHREAREALGAYWKALQGTIDPEKVEKAADNALIGNAQDIAAQIGERFDPDDRLMLWFDFFNHDCDRVIANMQDFMSKVVPLLGEGS